MAEPKGPPAVSVGRRALRGGDRRPLTTEHGPISRLITGNASPMHLLMAELLVGVLIVGVRAVADYEVKTTGTVTGTIGHPKGQLGPFPILAALIVSFFLLSFLAAGAASGKARAKVAVAFGALIDIALAMKSVKEIEKVATVFGGSFGKATPTTGVKTEVTLTSITTSGLTTGSSAGSWSSGGSSSKSSGSAPKTKTLCTGLGLGPDCTK